MASSRRSRTPLPTTSRSASTEAPPPLAAALARSAAARKVWDAIAPSHRREYARWITDAKKDETRARRVAQAVTMLAGGRKTPMQPNDAPAVSAAPVPKKLGLKPGQRLVAIDVPDGYEAKLGGAVATSGRGDVVVAFARDSRALARVAKRAFAATAEGGLVWIAYPKKTSGIETDLSRDHGWDAVKRSGWQGVSLVAIDESWAALRFRPA
jgi:hypothetical protein